MCAHDQWAVVGGVLPPAREGEPPDARTFLAPRSDYAIEDNWHVRSARGRPGRGPAGDAPRRELEFTGAQPGRAFIEPSVPELAVTVLPEHIGRGIGTLVLQVLLSETASAYERLGFQEVPGREFVHRVGGVSLVMARTLRP